MRVLIVGFSTIVQKKVLPALQALPEVTAIDWASRRGAGAVEQVSKQKLGENFQDYDTALARSKANLVYVSTVNSEHYAWSKRALEQDWHVIVDKPATLTLPEAELLVDLARQKQKCLAESTVFSFHPLIERALQISEESPHPPNHLLANFSFPPLDADNFRYRKELGGGALLDLCRYTVGPGRLFFSADPESVHCVLTDFHQDVDIGFSVLLTYPGGRTCTGHFGFDTEYRNQLVVLGPGLRIELNRVFTPPPDTEIPFYVTRNNIAETINLPVSNSFANFLSAVIDSIDHNRSDAWASTLLADARVSNQLQQAAERNG